MTEDMNCTFRFFAAHPVLHPMNKAEAGSLCLGCVGDRSDFERGIGNNANVETG